MQFAVIYTASETVTSVGPMEDANIASSLRGLGYNGSGFFLFFFATTLLMYNSQNGVGLQSLKESDLDNSVNAFLLQNRDRFWPDGAPAE